MAVEKINTATFLQLAQRCPVLDVRSPGEYVHAHIPGAFSLPLFTDEERKVVGTAYKQQSRQTAIKIGLDYFGIKMKAMVEEVEKITSKFTKDNNKSATINNASGGVEVLVHCWRGGMRSAGVAWLLDLYGFKVYTLTGGYKNFRQWARQQFEKPYLFNVLGGYTGSGKTLVLDQLKQRGKAVIDLEKIARHKGSAFGALGEAAQPTQEMFENLLAMQLAEMNAAEGSELHAEVIYIEDESQRIGLLNIPNALWNTMRNSHVSFLEIPFEERLNYLAAEYGKFSKENLVNAIIRIQKRLGGLETKTAIGYLLEDNHKECFRILLKYYDKYYEKGLLNRPLQAEIVNKIPCTGVDIKTITNILINEKTIA